MPFKFLNIIWHLFKHKAPADNDKIQPAPGSSVTWQQQYKQENAPQENAPQQNANDLVIEGFEGMDDTESLASDQDNSLHNYWKPDYAESESSDVQSIISHQGRRKKQSTRNDDNTSGNEDIPVKTARRRKHIDDSPIDVHQDNPIKSGKSRRSTENISRSDVSHSKPGKSVKSKTNTETVEKEVRHDKPVKSEKSRKNIEKVSIDHQKIFVRNKKDVVKVSTNAVSHDKLVKPTKNKKY